MDDFQDLILQEVVKSIDDYNTWLEMLVERALQVGECGVSVYHFGDGHSIGAVDPSVPYGTIHEYGTLTPKVVVSD